MKRSSPLLAVIALVGCSSPGGSGSGAPTSAEEDAAKPDEPSDTTPQSEVDAGTECVPSQRRCTLAGLVESCTAGGRWVTSEDCAGDGLTCVAGRCQGPCTRDPKSNDNSGCDYWAVDLDNHVSAQESPFAVIVSNLSAQTATVKVTRKDGELAAPLVVLEREVMPGALEVLDLPSRHTGVSGIQWTGYRVESSVPIIAYQFNPLDNVDVFSNDATILIPSDTFGTQYLVVSRFELVGKGADDDERITYHGEFSVVASEPETSVTVTPTCATEAGPNVPAMEAGFSYTYTIAPYQVLSVKSLQNACDLTGTLINSDKPVAVFGAHEAALTTNLCCADHLEHQLYPVSTWGTTYVASKAMPRQAESDYWRIVAANDATRVTFMPEVSPPRTLDRGEWIELTATRDFAITASAPISVAQTLASSYEVTIPEPYADCSRGEPCATAYTCDRLTPESEQAACFPPYCDPGSHSCPSGHVCTQFGDEFGVCTPVGDPTLIMPPPVKQYRKDYVLLVPDKYAEDYLNIIAPVEATVTLDDALVLEQGYRAIEGTGWKVARVPVADGVHRIFADLPVSVIAYGYDRDVSYGYAAGLNLVEE